MVKVVDGSIVDRFESYIRPEPGYDYFDFMNSLIHGITAADVENAPRFSTLWPQMQAFIGELPLVAHNAAFDMRVIRDTLDACGIVRPDLTYFCTLVLSRRVLNLVSYSLPFVVQELDVTISGHHRALVDAESGAGVALALLQRSGAASLIDLAESVKVRPGMIRADNWSGCKVEDSQSSKLGKARIEAIRDSLGVIAADPDGQLFGKSIVFTGTLSSMTRAEAAASVLQAGGLPQNTVNKKTELLVFGQQDAQHLRPGTDYSSKFIRAEMLRASGQAIEIVDERVFMTMLTND
ncbi:hypothetical protein MQH31_04815 [Cryobacterium sp. ZS14-85]|uniref:Exonuclease domain-containing protein n=2 Tax=Cryobacterium zhongshanensis TaxID=2928153 RepID=A0AA41QTP4_9MICO|nr:hypothetical protein [Cryobacterium zhongshanensis]